MALVAGVPTALRRLSSLGVWSVGLVGEAGQSLYELPLGDQPVALVLGSEGAGLATLTRKRCDVAGLHPPARDALLAQRGHRRCHRLLRRGPSAVRLTGLLVDGSPAGPRRVAGPSDVGTEGAGSAGSG